MEGGKWTVDLVRLPPASLPTTSEHSKRSGTFSTFCLPRSSEKMKDPANLARVEGGRWTVDLVRLPPASLPTPSDRSPPGPSKTSGACSTSFLPSSSEKMKDPANLARMGGGRWTVPLVRLPPESLRTTFQVSERSGEGDNGQNFKRPPVTSVETTKKQFKCMQCGKCFSQRMNLTSHKRSHPGEKPFKCMECGKTFRDDSLTLHQRTHTGEKPFKCKECGKSFHHSADLTKHCQIHTRGKPYKCLECGKCFSENGNLKKHQQAHIGEKPYECFRCGKCFITREKLNSHRRTHTRETIQMYGMWKELQF